MSLFRPAWVKLNRLQTDGIERFRSNTHKWDYASSAIHRAPVGIRGLMSLDVDRTSWLLHYVRSGLDKPSASVATTRSCSYDEDCRKTFCIDHANVLGGTPITECGMLTNFV